MLAYRVSKMRGVVFLLLPLMAVAFALACDSGEETDIVLGGAPPIGGDRYYSFVWERVYDDEVQRWVDRCVAVYELTDGRRKKADLEKCLSTEDQLKILDKYRDFLHKIPGVVGTGLYILEHERETSELPNENGIGVLVNDISVRDAIPSGLEGVAVNVQVRPR